MNSTDSNIKLKRKFKKSTLSDDSSMKSSKNIVIVNLYKDDKNPATNIEMSTIINQKDTILPKPIKRKNTKTKSVPKQNHITLKTDSNQQTNIDEAKQQINPNRRKSIKIKSIPPFNEPINKIEIKQENILTAINRNEPVSNTEIKSIPSIKLTRRRTKKIKSIPKIVIEKPIIKQEPIINIIKNINNKTKSIIPQIIKPINDVYIPHSMVVPQQRKIVSQKREISQRSEITSLQQNGIIPTEIRLHKTNRKIKSIISISENKKRVNIINQPILRKLNKVKSIVSLNEEIKSEKIDKQLLLHKLNKVKSIIPINEEVKLENVNKQPILHKLMIPKSIDHKIIDAEADIINTHITSVKYLVPITESINKKKKVKFEDIDVDSDDEMIIKYDD